MPVPIRGSKVGSDSQKVKFLMIFGPEQLWAWGGPAGSNVGLGEGLLGATVPLVVKASWPDKHCGLVDVVPAAGTGEGLLGTRLGRGEGSSP